MTEQEAILTKIKKLLALATSDNANEAAIAAAKAQELLLEYNISDEDLENFNSTQHEKVIEVSMAGKNGQGGNRTAWYDILANTVAKANLCTLLISGGNLIWIGKKTNIEVAQFIFENLVRDLTRIADATWTVISKIQKLEQEYPDPNKPYSDPVHGKTWKNNFYHGANQSIKARLTANLVQLKEVDKINALVVRNDIELKEYMNIKYPRLSYLNHTMSSNRSGFESGKAAGRSVPFRSGIGAGGSSGPKLLGKG